MKYKLLLVLLAFSSTLFAQTNKADSTGHYSGKGFHVEFPTKWKLDTSGLMGSTCFIYAPADDANDKFRENVNVVIQDLSGSGIDLEQYKDITEKQLPSIFPDSKLEESTVIQTAGKEPYYRVSYSFTRNGSSIFIITICYIQNEKAYLVTFSTETARKEQYIKTGETILKSFRLSSE